MKYNTIIITGISSGIGNACARFFLDKEYHVIGIGRNNDLEHENYDFYPLDLSDIKAVEDFQIPDLVNNKDIILINNAGVLGEIKPIWEQNQQNFSTVLQVNIIALAMLTQKFILQYASGLIINLSSGAGKRPVKGWSAYCASKAAVDLFSATLQEEFLYFNKPFIVKSIAPGVVNTPMQQEIRKADKRYFPDRSSFHELFDSGKLDDALLTAKKLFQVISSIDEYSETMLSLRDVDLKPEILK